MEQKLLPVSKCYESETNPRGTKFGGVSLNELVASIKEKGVLQPVLARPRKHGAKDFEIVAGNRRYRASTLAGLAEIPAIVKEMTDTEAREAQIIENLQRADIHPLEEGEAYRQLIEQSKFDIKAVGVHVGKSESYVRDRLLLTGLIAPAKTALREGEITAGHGSLIARLNAKTQKEALEFCTRTWSETATIAELREWIRDREYADASNAPWKNDEAMKLALGGCEECEGKGGDLFGKKAADACTNPKCYARRVAAFIAIKRKDSPDLVPLSAKYGTPDIEGALPRSQYEEITTKKGCEFEQKGIVVEGEGLGRILRMCTDTQCEKHGDSHTAGYQLSPEEKAKQRAERKKERDVADKKKAKENEVFLSALGRVKWPLSEDQLDVLFEATFSHFGFSYQQPIASRHGVKAVVKTTNGYKQRDLETPLRELAEKDGKLGKLRMVFEFALEGSGRNTNFLKQL